MSEGNTNNYCIALQPICDGAMRHVGDELLYRSGANATSAQIDDDQTATARVCNVAFYETGLQSLVGTRKIFVNTPQEWLLRPELLPPYPDQVVVEVLESVSGCPEIISALHNIRTLGYEVALDDFVLTAETRSLLSVASIVKFDLSLPFDTASVALCKARGIKLLAEKVEDLDTFNRLRAMGFELFQGYFYAKPETHRATSRHRTNNHDALLRLLSELQRDDINYSALEDLIAQDAQLTYTLLKYTNSALFHHRGAVLTLNQALATLGLKRIRTIALTILIANNGPASLLLLVQALRRAAMCERLAPQASVNADAAFTAGLISMMGVLLGEPLPELLERLPISQSIADTILLRHDALGKLLTSVEDFENASTGDWASAQVDLYNHVWLKSQAWTTQTLAAIDLA